MFVFCPKIQHKWNVQIWGPWGHWGQQRPQRPFEVIEAIWGHRSHLMSLNEAIEDTEAIWGHRSLLWSQRQFEATEAIWSHNLEIPIVSKVQKRFWKNFSYWHSVKNKRFEREQNLNSEFLNSKRGCEMQINGWKIVCKLSLLQVNKLASCYKWINWFHRISGLGLHSVWMTCHSRVN